MKIPLLNCHSTSEMKTKSLNPSIPDSPEIYEFYLLTKYKFATVREIKLGCVNKKTAENLVRIISKNAN